MHINLSETDVIAEPLSTIYHRDWDYVKAPADWKSFNLQEGHKRRLRKLQAYRSNLSAWKNYVEDNLGCYLEAFKEQNN